MIPSAPVPFAALGSLCYGELYFGLCRAMAAPWLDPWWLPRGRQSKPVPAPPGTAIAAPPSTSPKPVVAASAELSTTGATIIPFDRARARAAGRAPAGRV
jgi:hypothetical protein